MKIEGPLPPSSAAASESVRQERRPSVDVGDQGFADLLATQLAASSTDADSPKSASRQLAESLIEAGRCIFAEGPGSRDHFKPIDSDTLTEVLLLLPTEGALEAAAEEIAAVESWRQRMRKVVEDELRTRWDRQPR